MGRTLALVLGILLFQGQSLGAPRDLHYCSLVLQAKAQRQKLAELFLDITKKANTRDGLLFLLNHVEVFFEAGILTSSWCPLCDLPEKVPSNLLQTTYAQNYQILSILNQVRFAEQVNESGQPTPQALASQSFLVEVLQTVDPESKKRYPALFDLVKENVSQFTRVDTYQKSSGLTLGRLSRDLVEVAQSSGGIDQASKISQIYLQISPKEKMLDVPSGWDDIFAMPPKRSIHYLISPNSSDQAYEIFSVLRMMKLAHARPPKIELELSLYARQWLNVLFVEVLPRVPSSDDRYRKGRTLLTTLRVFDLSIQ